MPRQIIQLPFSIARDPAQRARCIHDVEEQLGQRQGIQQVRVVSDPQHADHYEHHHALVELDYDPDLISLAQINSYLRQAGTSLTDQIAHVILPVEGMVSPRLEQMVQAQLNRLPGVMATASYASKAIRLEFDRQKCPLPEVVRRLEQMGVELRPINATGVPALLPGLMRVHRPRWLALPDWLIAGLKQTDLVAAVLAGVFLMAGFLAHQFGGSHSLRVTLLVISYLLGGWFPALAMAATLRRIRIDIDLLMFAAAFGAAALGHYEEGAMLLFLFSLGGAGERLALDRARRAISALSKLTPQIANLIGPAGHLRQVKVEELQIDNQVLVRPGEQVPADGVIVSGASSINQAPITGESVPVYKTVDHDAFAGTINGDGTLTVRVTKLASDNTLAKVIRLVEEAQTTKSPTQIFTDRVKKWYVPLVLAATAGLGLIPPLLGLEPLRSHTSHWQGWFYQAMAFLTAASPCALAIGTPAAVLSGIARAARGGVLLKGGMHLENLGRLNVIAFDKTGTLTCGRPEVTDIIPLDGQTQPSELLALAAAIERHTTHPIAEAIVDRARDQDCPSHPTERIEQTPGLGVRGTVGGRHLTIGRVSMLASHCAGLEKLQNEIARLEREGKTTVSIADEKQVLGVIGLADQPRAGVQEMIQDLKHLGIKHTIMLTGDNARTAQMIARQVGVDEYLADLLPQDKLNAVRQLDEKYGQVAMVGDGVNDAPALANATVGIALGGATGAGSDVALETADVALLANDLRKLPEAIGISRFARRIVLQNLVIALGVIAVLAPIAAFGGAPISAAVFFHEGSTVVVVLNALRILAYRPHGG